MSEFWMGVLALPVSGLALLVAYLLGRLALLGMAVTIASVAPKTNQPTRALMASVLFAARRARVWAIGPIAVAFVWRMDPSKRKEAYEALNPPRSLGLSPEFVKRMSNDTPTPRQLKPEPTESESA